MYELIKSKLESHPDFRERKHRGKYLAILALRECKLEKTDKLTHEELSSVCVAYGSLERAWRSVTADYKELRGTDYDQKVELEQKKQIELGYQPSFEQLNKKLVADFDKHD
jgi:hypothetical protein